ncbi:MAG: zinc-ribbon domain-containing protein [Sideroxydans sp.]|jgi:Zn finger protein HypA/HybF involved in hydrogenase expression
MALINCNECQKEISDKATTCPHCGAPTVVLQKIEQANNCKKCGTPYITEQKPVSLSPVLLLSVPLFLFGIVLFAFNWLAALIVIGIAFMVDHFGRSKKTVVICPKCKFQPY